ncbi:MAG TPA: PDZ domain-containing protein [Verrucomicrobiae bacterium]|nr:PDZ domain-containing protein [Verrucomicrobiae bacterium]
MRIKTSNSGLKRATLRLALIVAVSSCSALASSTSAVVATTPAPAVAPRAVVKIESIEPASRREGEGDVTWLGVYAEEASEALGSQLGLSSGEGLLVTYVAADSPAAKAGLQKNDVMVALRDQLLVHPSQLIKLIRAQKDGDVVNLTIYRQGKKQVITATLGKRPEAAAMWPTGTVSAVVDWKPGEGSTVQDGIHGQIRDLHEDLMRLGADKEKVKLEVERSMEEARKALQDALMHKSQNGAVLGLDAKDLEALAKGGVDIGESATIVVKKNGHFIRTIVQTDDTGSYVIAAIPKKRLTARDKDGKLLFDGEIETPEQQGKVPAELWDKVKPLLQQLKPVESDEPKPRVESQTDDLNS